MPTSFDLAPPAYTGVSVTTAATVTMQIAIPTAPTSRRKRLPYLSTVQVAFRVKIIPNVPFNALMSWICELSVNTFLYMIVE